MAAIELEPNPHLSQHLHFKNETEISPLILSQCLSARDALRLIYEWGEGEVGAGASFHVPMLKYGIEWQRGSDGDWMANKVSSPMMWQPHRV